MMPIEFLRGRHGGMSVRSLQVFLWNCREGEDRQLVGVGSRIVPDRKRHSLLFIHSCFIHKAAAVAIEIML